MAQTDPPVKVGCGFHVNSELFAFVFYHYCLRFLAEIKEVPIIYSATESSGRNGSIKAKDGMKEILIYEGLVYRMAFDPVRRELFWCNYAEDNETDEHILNGTFRLILTNNRNEGPQIAPQPFLFQFEG